MSDFYEAIYALVRRIPRGRVMSYGQIAAILGCPRAARAVGYAMHASGRLDDVPWQRVINGRGRISARNEVERPLIQRMLLEAEGVVFDEAGACEMAVYRWEPPNPEAYYFEPGGKVDW
ncbi:MAG: methylated-DNA-protein-cysteine methyltransferase related protein [Candidatus Hydrogenedentes bacterium]|nr:methylated-DNA-protein-cysteine methyltransferase related protein [Candidatus Hydrogenedentota bacterium]